MSKVFESISINGMTLSNRFVRSATWEGLAGEDGAVTARLDDMMRELARNEIGLIISGYAFVTADGQSSPYQMAAYDDRFVPGLKGMADAVHSAGGKIALQIVHAGKFSNPALTGGRPMGPSADDGCREMTTEDIARVTAAFVQAAVMAKAAGFDAVQLHAAHGFLLSQFLSPAFNQRRDDYGGILENRARLLLEIVAGIRSAVGLQYPILVKLNSEDFLENGLTLDEAVEVAAMLEAASVGSIEFSGGTVVSQELSPPRPGQLKSRESEGYYRDAAILYKKKVRIPLMLVGGIRSVEVAGELVEDGVTDLIALSRPLLAEPDLVKRWHHGDSREAICVSCNKCFGPAMEGKGVRCALRAGGGDA